MVVRDLLVNSIRLSLSKSRHGWNIVTPDLKPQAFNRDRDHYWFPEEAFHLRDRLSKTGLSLLSYSETKPKPVANNNNWSPSKGTGWHECPSKTQISLRIRLVWSESSMVALWAAKGSTFLQARNQRSDCADVQSGFYLSCTHMLTWILCWIPAQLINETK